MSRPRPVAACLSIRERMRATAPGRSRPVILISIDGRPGPGRTHPDASTPLLPGRVIPFIRYSINLPGVPAPLIRKRMESAPSRALLTRPVLCPSASPPSASLSAPGRVLEGELCSPQPAQPRRS